MVKEQRALKLRTLIIRMMFDVLARPSKSVSSSFGVGLHLAKTGR
jgi:hypothetical protein